VRGGAAVGAARPHGALTVPQHLHACGHRLAEMCGCAMHWMQAPPTRLAHVGTAQACRRARLREYAALQRAAAACTRRQPALDGSPVLGLGAIA